MQACESIWSHVGHLQASGGNQEAPRRHPGGTQEAPRRHPGDTQEAPKRHPKPRTGTQGCTGHLGGIFRSDLIEVDSHSNRMQKLLLNFNFTSFLLVALSLCIHFCQKMHSRTEWVESCRNQGPFTITIRTPLAEASLGNKVNDN